MKILVPKEHGAWAMLLIPFAIGTAIQEQTWLQVPLFFGWFFLYLASNPLMMMARNPGHAAQYRKFVIIYGFVAAAFLILPITRYPALLWLGVVLLIILPINLYYARMNRERELFNDFTAVAGLCLGAVISGYAGAGGWSEDLFPAWLFCVLFFMGSVFFVKTMIRERGNRSFRKLSWGYHVAVIFLILFVTESWVLTVAYLPSLARAILYTPKVINPMKIGILETANSLLFFTLVILFFR